MDVAGVLVGVLEDGWCTGGVGPGDGVVGSIYSSSGREREKETELWSASRVSICSIERIGTVRENLN